MLVMSEGNNKVAIFCYFMVHSPISLSMIFPTSNGKSLRMTYNGISIFMRYGGVYCGHQFGF